MSPKTARQHTTRRPRSTFRHPRLADTLAAAGHALDQPDPRTPLYAAVVKTLTGRRVRPKKTGRR